jgi:thiosulfate/3-mercaptopyruvate sulfurtransferase
MKAGDLPLIIEPDALQQRLGEEGLLVVDLSKPEVHSQFHVPTAVHLDYPRIIGVRQPVMGLLPDLGALSEVLASIGMNPDAHVVAYDDEGGGKASRLLWTLEVIGHRGYSLLNGGLHAWGNERHPLDDRPSRPRRGEYPIEGLDTTPIADGQYVLDHLDDPGVVLLDARTPEEYQGTKVLAARGGHIPGAVNLDWTETMDKERNLRLKPEVVLRGMLEERGITPDKEVVTYCQTHHRSAHSYIMLRSLGYSRVKGYPGSWSEWGNIPDAPIE